MNKNKLNSEYGKFVSGIINKDSGTTIIYNFKEVVDYIREKDRDIEHYKFLYDSLETKLSIILNDVQDIIDLGFDYDGFNKEEDLKGLIDELVSRARNIRHIIKDGLWMKD